MSRDLRPQAKIEYTVQVQMRFCLIDTAKEQDDCFPNSICVRVNGKMAPLPVSSNLPLDGRCYAPKSKYALIFFFLATESYPE